MYKITQEDFDELNGQMQSELTRLLKRFVLITEQPDPVDPAPDPAKIVRKRIPKKK